MQAQQADTVMGQGSIVCTKFGGIALNSCLSLQSETDQRNVIHIMADTMFGGLNNGCGHGWKLPRPLIIIHLNCRQQQWKQRRLQNKRIFCRAQSMQHIFRHTPPKNKPIKPEKQILLTKILRTHFYNPLVNALPNMPFGFSLLQDIRGSCN